MTDQQIEKEQRWIQLPIRLEAQMAATLDRYSKATRIPKSEIARSSIRRFIIELERSGVRGALENMHKAQGEIK